MDYQIKRLKKYRTRVVKSILGFIYCNGKLYYSGVLLGYVEIIEEKIRERYSYFDDGYSYQTYWSDWVTSWNVINIEKV